MGACVCVCGCVVVCVHMLSHGHLSTFFLSPAIAWEAEAGLIAVFIQSERLDVSPACYFILQSQKKLEYLRP